MANDGYRWLESRELSTASRQQGLATYTAYFFELRLKGEKHTSMHGLLLYWRNSSFYEQDTSEAFNERLVSRCHINYMNDDESVSSNTGVPGQMNSYERQSSVS